MKVAVATIDGNSLSQHFGQSKGFVVFEVENTTVVSREFRTNNHTPHAQGLCNHDGHHEHGTHSHANILGLLGDCNFVLCGGMGAGAAQALRNLGIEPVILQGTLSAEDAVACYISGTATINRSGTCNCHH